jgi:hypothetical protein
LQVLLLRLLLIVLRSFAHSFSFSLQPTLFGCLILAFG